MLYLITYDLKRPIQNYTELFNLLRNKGDWWHYLDSTWLIRSNDSINSLADDIRNILDPNDRFLIFEVTGKYSQGWLSSEAWEWINSHNN